MPTKRRVFIEKICNNSIISPLSEISSYFCVVKVEANMSEAE